MDDNQVIHYVKPDEIYGIYGSITLIFMVLLIWYFVRSNMFIEEGMITLENSSVLEMMPEWGGGYAVVPKKSTIMDTKGNFCGSYGGVQTCIYDVANGKHNPEWDHATTIHLPNSRTLYKQSNISHILTR
jgi:hypothetical protein